MTTVKKTALCLVIIILLVFCTAISFASWSGIVYDEASAILEIQNPSGQFRTDFIKDMIGYTIPGYGHRGIAPSAFINVLDGKTDQITRYGLTLDDLKNEDGEYYDSEKCWWIIANAIVNSEIEQRNTATVNFLWKKYGLSTQQAEYLINLALKDNITVNEGDSVFIDYVLIYRTNNNAIYYAFDFDSDTVLAFSSVSPIVYCGTYSGDLSDKLILSFDIDGSVYNEEMEVWVEAFGTIVRNKAYGKSVEFLEGSAKEAEKVLAKKGFDVRKQLDSQKTYVQIAVGCAIRKEPSYDGREVVWGTVCNKYELIDTIGEY